MEIKKVQVGQGVLVLSLELIYKSCVLECLYAFMWKQFEIIKDSLKD